MRTTLAGCLMPHPVSGRVGLLDPYPTALWGAWGPDLLRGNYFGAALRLQRPSDSAELDFGWASPTATFVDLVAIAAWLNGETGRIVRWYDQSGGGNDLAAAPSVNITQQSDGHASFSGSVPLVSVTNSGTPSGMTAFIDCVPNDGNGSNAFFSLSGSDNSSVAGGYFTYNNNTSKLNSRVSNVGNSNTRQYGVMSQPTRHVFGVRWDRTQQGALADQHHVLMDGAVQVDTGSPGGVVFATGNFTPQPWYLAGLASSSAMIMTCGLFAVWERAIDDSEMLSISSAIENA